MTFLCVRSGTDHPGSCMALLLNFSYREISDMLAHIGYVDIQQLWRILRKQLRNKDPASLCEVAVKDPLKFITRLELCGSFKTSRLSNTNGRYSTRF
jgi:hypothetical protein